MTPTSATGARPARERGFTLVEMMVVVTIIGLVAGLAVLAVPDGRPSVSLEAERLGARLQRAREEAVLTNRAVEVAVTPAGYRFQARGEAGWRPLTEPPFGEVAWLEGTAVRGEGTVVFDPAGWATPAAFRLTREGRGVRVLVDPAGNVRIHAVQGG